MGYKIKNMKCKKFRPSLKDFLKAMDKAEREIRLQSETGFQRKSTAFKNKKRYSRKSKHPKRSLGFFYAWWVWYRIKNNSSWQTTDLRPCRRKQMQVG